MVTHFVFQNRDTVVVKKSTSRTKKAQVGQKKHKSDKKSTSRTKKVQVGQKSASPDKKSTSLKIKILLKFNKR